MKTQTSANKLNDMKKEWTDNEVISFMHRERETALRAIANHVEKHEYDSIQIIELLREIADEAEAQAMVVDLRDQLNNLNR